MTAKQEGRKTGNAVEIIHREFYEGNPEELAGLREARLNARIARTIYQLRTEAGLTQGQLAELVNTSTSTICRLEDDDYEGHSLTMLKRIAEALNMELDVVFKPRQENAPESDPELQAA